MQKVISFPHMGNYYVPVEMMLKYLFKDLKVIPSPKITKKTLDLGSKYSPDYVCAPFKYNLGNYIEALNSGANILIQAGGGCRYGYYAEIQEQILRDLGYEFEFIKLLRDSIEPITLYKVCKRIGTTLSFRQFLYYVLLSIKMVKILDNFETYIRRNIGFETVPGTFEKTLNELLDAFQTVNSFKDLSKVEKTYDKKFRNIKINKPADCLKVGVVGELYSLMEPFSNFFIEKELAKNNIQVDRYITITYLLFEKMKQADQTLKLAGKYLKYTIGADGTDSVEKSRVLAEKGYDGIIHVKPFGCMPEINAMPMMQKISNDYEIPIIYFSFDSQTSEIGIKTRLEAFNDMIIMRKEQRNANSVSRG